MLSSSTKSRFLRILCLTHPLHTPHTHRPEKNTDHYIIGKPLASRLWVSSVGFCLNRTKEIAWHGTQRRPTRVMTRVSQAWYEWWRLFEYMYSYSCLQLSSPCQERRCRFSSQASIPEQTTSHPILPAQLGRTPIRSNTLAFDLIGQACMPCSTRGWSTVHRRINKSYKPKSVISVHYKWL